MTAPILELDRVTAGYGLITVLDGVGLQLHPGEILAVLGANGSSTYSLYDNTLSKSGGVRTGVVSVTITVTKVTTADANWNTITNAGYGTTTTINSI